ncbi:hypothetical protein T10_13414 [Trichinella papuae]|uniref:Uncharacterized protein n=1 Tax=Trichinella papuae TaxID=268474 RepID=A0A0V1MN43_9BILA|nr:hypothetical protein T10_13414 [Trichinella papuae]
MHPKLGTAKHCNVRRNRMLNATHRIGNAEKRANAQPKCQQNNGNTITMHYKKHTVCIKLENHFVPYETKMPDTI